MIKLKEIIVVEGKYDKIKLSSIVDAMIITTEGFGIFKDKDKLEMIRILAKKNGIIIMTDGDASGFKIRNYLKGAIKDARIINIYLPDIFGKEKRKSKPAAEGKLGVEGMPIKTILEAIQKANISSEMGDDKRITKLDFYEDGLSGRENSAQLRRNFLKIAGLPERLSANSLIEVINGLYDYDEYKEIIKKARTY